MIFPARLLGDFEDRVVDDTLELFAISAGEIHFDGHTPGGFEFGNR